MKIKIICLKINVWSNKLLFLAIQTDCNVFYTTTLGGILFEERAKSNFRKVAE